MIEFNQYMEIKHGCIQFTNDILTWLLIDNKFLYFAAKQSPFALFLKKKQTFYIFLIFSIATLDSAFLLFSCIIYIISEKTKLELYVLLISAISCTTLNIAPSWYQLIP